MTPDPEPRAARLPPDRRPPTAVGVLTPPPPRRRGPGPAFSSFDRNRALLLALLASGVAGVALLLFGEPFWFRATGGSLSALAFLGLVQVAEFALGPTIERNRERRWLRMIASRG